MKLLDVRRGQLQGTAAGKLQDVFELKVLVGDCIAAAFLDFFMSVSVSDIMPHATCGCARARRRAAGAAERSKTAARVRLHTQPPTSGIGPGFL